jgi:hypothetical protein
LGDRPGTRNQKPTGREKEKIKSKIRSFYLGIVFEYLPLFSFDNFINFLIFLKQSVFSALY